jgi:hypothetical protein
VDCESDEEQWAEAHKAEVPHAAAVVAQARCWALAGMKEYCASAPAGVRVRVALARRLHDACTTLARRLHDACLFTPAHAAPAAPDRSATRDRAFHP